jgi:hypothetical protein
MPQVAYCFLEGVEGGIDAGSPERRDSGVDDVFDISSSMSPIDAWSSLIADAAFSR